MPTFSFLSSDPPLAAGRLTRRRLASLAGSGILGLCLGGCGQRPPGQAIDVSGSSPPLAFTMVRVSDGKEVAAADYWGQVVMLFIGYTSCPDVCPMTLSNITDIMAKLGGQAGRVRALFVTVDPGRDTRAVLADYISSFAPQIEGLRGTPDELAALARRYRLVYSVTPASGGQPYEVTHSAAIYIFDRSGAARLLVPSLASAAPDIGGTVANLKRLVEQPDRSGLWARIQRMV